MVFEKMANSKLFIDDIIINGHKKYITNIFTMDVEVIMKVNYLIYK
jgi:hypothetical protein